MDRHFRGFPLLEEYEGSVSLLNELANHFPQLFPLLQEIHRLRLPVGGYGSSGAVNQTLMHIACFATNLQILDLPKWHTLSDPICVADVLGRCQKLRSLTVSFHSQEECSAFRAGLEGILGGGPLADVAPCVDLKRDVGAGGDGAGESTMRGFGGTARVGDLELTRPLAASLTRPVQQGRNWHEHPRRLRLRGARWGFWCGPRWGFRWGRNHEHPRRRRRRWLRGPRDERFLRRLK